MHSFIFLRVLQHHTWSHVSLISFSRVYNIGIETSRGVGRYHDTSMVVLVPRNKIINKSSHRVAFTQKHLTKPQVCYMHIIHIYL